MAARLAAADAKWSRENEEGGMGRDEGANEKKRVRDKCVTATEKERAAGARKGGSRREKNPFVLLSSVCAPSPWPRFSVCLVFTANKGGKRRKTGPVGEQQDTQTPLAKAH